MKFCHSCLTTSLLALMVTTISSCSPTPPSVEQSPQPIASSPSLAPSASPTPSPTPATSPPATNLNPQKTVAINLYQPDRQCLDLVPKKVAVAAATPIASAVGAIVRDQRSTDFQVSHYQVNLQGETAIVDLQVAPGSKRQFSSLSACEQMALFGSIQKTLTSNAAWQIRAVEFTEQGKALVF